VTQKKLPEKKKISTSGKDKRTISGRDFTYMYFKVCFDRLENKLTIHCTQSEYLIIPPKRFS